MTATKRSALSPEMRTAFKTAFACFGVSAGLMALIYFCIGVPFFGNSVLVLDLNGQYVYFFESLHDAIYHGGSLLWSWGRSLGGEYMGIYAYYLASPLSWLVALMPSAVITESLYLMILFKVGFAGGAMGWFLHRTYPTDRRNVVLFSALYALCAWSLMYGNNVMWLDALMLFPLVLRGADLLLSRRGYILYTVALALSILANFYMGYMTVLFLVLYFFYHHIVRSKDADYNPDNEKAHFWRSGLRYLFFTLLAVGISAVIVLSAAYSLSFGKNTFTDPTYEFSFKLTFLDLVYKLLPGAIDTVRREGLPFLYCGTAALFGASIFFTSEKFKVREKFGTGLLFLLLALCFSVSVIDIWWHGGQEPNWLNYRYSYMFSFFLLVAGYRGFALLEKTSSRFLAATPAVIFVFYVILQAHGYGKGYEYTDGILPEAFSYDLFYYFIGVLLVGGVFAGILYYKKSVAKRAGTVVLCAVILGEAVLMGVLHHVGLAMDVGYSLRSSYAGFVSRVEPAVNAVAGEDESFFRMDKTFHRQPADAMAFSMRSLSSTTSTLNRRTLTFLRRMGLAGGSYWSEYKGATPAADMLFGVKYLLSDGTLYDGLYERIYTDESVGTTPYEEMDNPYSFPVYGYRNDRALPLAFTASEEALSFDVTAYGDPLSLQNALIAALTGQDDPVFRALHTSAPETEGITVGRSSSTKHAVYTTAPEGGALTYTFTADRDGAYYFYAATDYPRECSLTLDGAPFGTVMGNDSKCVIFLGRFSAGSAHTLRLFSTENKFYLKEGTDFFWYLDEAALQSAYELLSMGGVTFETPVKEDFLRGSVTVREDRPYLFTTIPYDEGWKLTVDGARVQPMLFKTETIDPDTKETEIELQPYADALLLYGISPGTHTVEFSYEPECVKTGGAISLGSTAIFALILLADKLIFPRILPKKRRKAARTRDEKPTAVPNGNTGKEEST